MADILDVAIACGHNQPTWLGGYDIQPLLDKAREEEREACAKVAIEAVKHNYGYSGEVIASAIRARGNRHGQSP